MTDGDAEWVDVEALDKEWGKPGAPITDPPLWRDKPTMRPPRPHTAPPHDADDRLPTDSGSSSTTIIALSVGGVLAVLLVLMLVYLFVLRKRYKSVKTQKNAAEYQVRIEDAAHVISNMDETCNTYVNTTDLQKLVNTVRAKGKSQERLPVPPRLQKPALSASPSSDNINNGFTPDRDVAVRPPKPAPSHYKPPLVPPYETVVLNPDFNSNGNQSDINGVYTNMDGKENDSKEPKFLIPFKTLSIQEAQLVATTESLNSSQNSSVVTTTVSPISRPKVEPPKVPSTSSKTSAAASRPAPPPPPNAVKKSESSHSIKKSASSDSLKVAPLTAPKPSVPKNSKPTQPTPPANQKPFTLAPSKNSKPVVSPPIPPSNPKPSAIIPQSNPKPTVPSNPKPSPILPPTHSKPTPVIPMKNLTSSDSSRQNKLLSSVKKGKLPLLPPLKTGLTPSLSRDASLDTPETAMEYLTPDCAESSPATASISAKIAFLEGKMKTINQ